MFSNFISSLNTLAKCTESSKMHRQIWSTKTHVDKGKWLELNPGAQHNIAFMASYLDWRLNVNNNNNSMSRAKTTGNYMKRLCICIISMAISRSNYNKLLNKPEVKIKRWFQLKKIYFGNILNFLRKSGNQLKLYSTRAIMYS